MFTRKASVLAMALGLSFFAASCTKKVGAPPPPNPVRGDSTPTKPKVAPRPIIKFFTAEPASIERGQVSVLRFEVTGADSASIDNGIGEVGTGNNITGRRNVFPSQTTSYVLSATNAGGTVTETVTVSVNAAPAKPPIGGPKPPEETFTEVIARSLKDV